MNQITSKVLARSNLIALAIAVAVAGSVPRVASAGPDEQHDAAAQSGLRESAIGSNLPHWFQSEQPVLRNRSDSERGRLWVLTSDGVDLYAVARREKVAHVDLAGWIWVGEQYSCPPDLALGPSGEALISSNVMPTLWRVDPVTLAVSRHELVLDKDTTKDVGFTELAYSANLDAFFAVSGMNDSLWRIGPDLTRAQKIALAAPLAKACGPGDALRASERTTDRSVNLGMR